MNRVCFTYLLHKIIRCKCRLVDFFFKGFQYYCFIFWFFILQVYHAVWLPSVLWAVWFWLWMGTWGDVLQLSGDTLQLHTGRPVWVPRSWMELHLGGGEGSHQAPAGSWTQETIHSSWCTEGPMDNSSSWSYSFGNSKNSYKVQNFALAL